MHMCPENWFFLSDACWHLEDSLCYDWEDKYPSLTKVNHASRVIHLMNMDPPACSLKSSSVLVFPAPLGPFPFISHVAAIATEIWSCYPPNYNLSITPCALKMKTKIL